MRRVLGEQHWRGGRLFWQLRPVNDQLRALLLQRFQLGASANRRRVIANLDMPDFRAGRSGHVPDVYPLVDDRIIISNNVIIDDLRVFIDVVSAGRSNHIP
ncbi:MAG TPA: hypothetical protein VFA77_06005 [Candidatus Eisenbacteria bacterium]|nr:hypothetical protein [Candidatus Eisenbacteria bacterium]